MGEPVLTAETAALFRAVADRWAGSFVDVVRLGVPSRHAAAEAKASVTCVPLDAPAATGFDAYRAGAAFLGAVREGRPARAVWGARPGEDWPARLAEVVQVALAQGRGAMVVVPDVRDLARLDAALRVSLGEGRHVALSADLGPSERYRRWLSVKRGAVKAVIGTRAAAYAPVADLGLLAIWDDGDDLHAELRAPYPHARDVLALRSSLTGAALLIGGFARTAEAQLLVDSGWAHEIVADRSSVRAAGARVAAVGDDVELARDPAAAAARLPSLAWRTAREALSAGHPVLVQVPRGGYVPSLACQRDRTPARCPVCAGPLAASSGHAVAACRWCGRPAGDWACPRCGERRLRAVVVGSGRTAEELGRAFPGTPVWTSGGERVLDRVARRRLARRRDARGRAGRGRRLRGGPAPGRLGTAVAPGPSRRRGDAAPLDERGCPRPPAAGGSIVGADASVPAVQALVRWDPAGFAVRELADRTALGFAPATRMAALTGTASAVAELIEAAQLPDDAEVIGPVPAGKGQERMLVRVPRSHGVELARALKAGAVVRSARKAAEPVKLVLDPLELV